MPKTLSEEQVQAYDRKGVHFPVPVLAAAEIERFRLGVAAYETALGEPPGRNNTRNLHLFHEWAFEMVTHPRVLDAVEDVLGPDLMVHTSTLFYKHPRDGSYASWHQDTFYLGLTEFLYASAWIAMTDSSADNGCLRVVPGSHRGGLQDHAVTSLTPENMLAGMEVVRKVDERTALNVVLQPGEMSMHHAAIVHGSNPNLSDRPRMGFAVRYVSPRIQQTNDHIPVVLVRGRDGYGHYRVLKSPPRFPDVSQAIDAQGELQRWIASRSNGGAIPLPAGIGLMWDEPRSGAR